MSKRIRLFTDEPAVGLRLADDLKILPSRGDKLFHGGKEAGYVTSALKSPAANANRATSATSRTMRRPIVAGGSGAGSGFAASSSAC